MAAKVYLETSIISYLAARPSRNVILAGNQRSTRLWWNRRRSEFEIVASDAVVEECGQGHPDAARRRAEYLRSCDVLRI